MAVVVGFWLLVKVKKVILKNRRYRSILVGLRPRLVHPTQKRYEKSIGEVKIALRGVLRVKNGKIGKDSNLKSPLWGPLITSGALNIFLGGFETRRIRFWTIQTCLGPLEWDLKIDPRSYPKRVQNGGTCEGSRPMNQKCDPTMLKNSQNDHWSSGPDPGSLVVTEI